MEWGRPRTGKEIQAFMGFTNFFRNLIPNYSKIAAPLERLRSKRKILDGDWKNVEREAFDSMRNIILNNTILSPVDWNKQFYLGTDWAMKSSGNWPGVGAVLFQKDNNGNIKYIRFAAKSVSKSEKNYGATKGELLAIIFALNKFRYYLLGRKFYLITDHKALTYINTQEKDLIVNENIMKDFQNAFFETT